MPGIVVFQRRWSVGSDDLIVPASFLIAFHFLWLGVLAITFIRISDDESNVCKNDSTVILIGFLSDWFIALLVELSIVVISMKGSVLNDVPRKMIEILLYFKLGKIFFFYNFI